MAYVDTGAYSKWKAQQDAAKAAATTPAPTSNGSSSGFGLAQLLSGIGQGFSDFGKSAVDLFGTGGAAVVDTVKSITSGKATNQTQDDFRKWLYNTDDVKDAAAKGLGVAISGVNTVADFIPGVNVITNNPLANSVQGGLQGLADELKEKGTGFDVGNAGTRAASGALAGLATGGLNKALSSKASTATGVLGKALNSNVARGATSGALGGAIGSGSATALQGGDLGQVLSNALSSAAAGGVTGGVAGGVIGAGTKVAKKLTNKNVSDATDIQTAQNITNENNSVQPKTTKQIKAQKAVSKTITDEIGVAPKRVNDRTNPSETIYNVVKDTGLTTADDVRAGTKALVDTTSKVIRDAAGGAGVIDMTDANKLVSELGMSGTSVKKYGSLISELVDETPSTISGNKSGVDALTLQRQIEKLANTSDAAGTIERGGVTYNADRLYEIAHTIGDNLNSAVKSSKSLGGALDANAQQIQALRDMYPDNVKWQTTIDKMVDSVDSATPMSTLRSSIKDATRAQIYIESADKNSTTYGGRMTSDIPTSKGSIINTAVNKLADKVENTDKARNARIDRNLKIAEGGEAPNRATPTAASVLPNSIMDIIGRSEGATQGGQVIGAMQQPENIETANAAQDSPNQIANTNALTTASTSNNVATSSAQQQLSTIQKAIELALAAGDGKSYASLLGLYNDAYSAYENQLSATGTTTNLNSTQQNQLAKLESAGTALDQLESLFDSAGGGQGVIGGNLASFLGSIGANSNASTYNQMAKGLVNQIAGAFGKTDSLNTEGEVARALELIPKLIDDAQTAKNKLASLRSMLEDNINTYSTLYGLSS